MVISSEVVSLVGPRNETIDIFDNYLGVGSVVGPGVKIAEF